jgi:hypothetical protein
VQHASEVFDRTVAVLDREAQRTSIPSD